MTFFVLKGLVMTETTQTIAAGAPTIALLPDQVVLRSDRASEIAKIEVGDRVVAGDGRFQQIQRVVPRSYSGQIVAIKPMGCLPLRVQPDQHILTRSETGQHLWKRAQELTEGDWLALPRMKQSMQGTGWDSRQYALSGQLGSDVGAQVDLADPDVAWFAGRFLADGSSTLYDEEGQQRGLASLYVGQKKTGDVERACRIAVFRFNKATPYLLYRGGEVRIDFGRTTIARMLRDKVGSDSGTKHLPPETWGLPDPALKALLAGWMSGDACGSAGGVVGRTVSRSLAMGLQTAFARLGVLCSVRREDRGEVVIRDQKVLSQPIFNLSVGASAMRDCFGWESTVSGSSLKHRVDEHYLYVPVKTVSRELYSGTVYEVRTERGTCALSGTVIMSGKHGDSMPANPQIAAAGQQRDSVEVAA